MKKQGIGRKLTAVLLTLVMLLSMLPATALAAVGDLSSVSTGLTGNIDTSDTISLPIEILDYESDGMLFEFAENYAGKSGNDAAKTATDFGATWAADFAAVDAASAVTNSMFGNFWSDVTTSLNTSNSYASRLRVTWAENTANNNGAFYGRSSVITPNDLGGMAMNNVRYLVMVYRSNVSSGNIGFWVERANLTTRTNASNRTGDLNFTNKGDDGKGSSTNWTYAVYDLKQGNLNNTWSSYGNATSIFTTLPLDASGEWMDIAHVALFADPDQANAFGEYAITDGSERGDNRAFGLLRGSRNQKDNTSNFLYPSILDETTTVEQFNTYSGTATKDYAELTTLGYKLLGTFGLKGIANIGLLESGLSAEGYPVYKQEVVTYLANLLKHSLEIPERTSDGWKNYRYVKGTASPVYGNVDLATALRNKIKGNMGSYAAASGKDLVGTWAEVGGNIASYYDAAYFLLNSIFVPGSYNVEKPYDYLVLSAGTDSETGDKTYVFDAGFVNTTSPAATTPPAIDYNTANGTIQNTDATGKAHFVYEGSSTTTLNPFTPITDRNTEAGMTKSPYYQDDGVINGVKKVTSKDSLYKKNFSFAIKSEGEFVYHADDELFFEFEGDDDVYLFINGELVLDNGSAHSINSVRINVNDYVNAAKAGTLGSTARNEALALEEGQTCTFKFYYLERHSYGSNLRMSTNIKVTDPTMATTKTAWQNSTQLDYGSIVDKDNVVEYGFAITNSGKEKLFDLSFTDNNIGVKLDPTNGLKVTGSRVFDVNGGTLQASDLTAIVSHPDYADITVSFADNNALKTFLADLTAAGTEEKGGLFIGATVTIRGIGYKLSTAEVNAGVFDNTVLTSAANETGSKTLQSQATMRVFVPADPMYYEWAGHDLKISESKLIEDILAAAKQSDNILAGKVPNLTTSNVSKIELVTKNGTAISSDYVKIASNNLTINYPTAGSKVFYVKITSSAGSVPIIPVLVNVTDVENSVYVLDYGLSVNLTGNNASGINELTKNDTLTVPGRPTSTSILGIGSNGKYANNEITFSGDADGVIANGNNTFTLSGQTLTYLPKDFMSAAEKIQIAMNVYESGITPSKISGTLDINSEVEMYKDITVLPANVVYYEDCFPAITYTGTKTQTNTFDKLGSQSNDQDSNYGSDEYYDDDADESAGALTTITIDSADKAAEFTFTGTGFELIGRTNAYDSATLIVRVKDASGKYIKTLPVITEFDNHNDGGTEEIYQVPVIRVKDLDCAAYTVEISGVPANIYDENGNKIGTKDTKLYVDGLRIFQPLGDSNANYDDDENGATFTEIRDLVVEGKAGVADYNGESMTVSSGFTTWVEHYDAAVYEGNEVASVDDYLTMGPNNELYILGEYADKALVFYATDDGDPDTIGSLQIGVRGIDRGLFVGSGATGVDAKLYYGAGSGSNFEWKELTTIASSTEQYVTVPLKDCYYDSESNRYQVAIKVGMPDGEGPDGMVSFTSLKYKNVSIVETIGEPATLYYNEGILTNLNTNQAVQAANYFAFNALSAQMRSTTIGESVSADDNGLVTAPGGNDDEGSIPVVMGRPGYEDMIAQLLAN